MESSAGNKNQQMSRFPSSLDSCDAIESLIYNLLASGAEEDEILRHYENMMRSSSLSSKAELVPIRSMGYVIFQ